ncbi:hypothetical protein [Nannocystis punicea]|uniref:Uncharacterized protein n=1 Tax=Nannocystis punicea TaxID=2995304 RepID=A0ABY7H642_9BACT|nr:hypothetical protein [Nannocystis poenicansa]WAS94489.1 hypothetical protein O0S08_50880 [Nannocystis poenicansa]
MRGYGTLGLSQEYYACLTELPCMDFEMHAGCDAQQTKVTETCGTGL